MYRVALCAPCVHTCVSVRVSGWLCGRCVSVCVYYPAARLDKSVFSFCKSMFVEVQFEAI